jgi:hypothetical protein
MLSPGLVEPLSRITKTSNLSLTCLFYFLGRSNFTKQIMGSSSLTEWYQKCFWNISFTQKSEIRLFDAPGAQMAIIAHQNDPMWEVSDLKRRTGVRASSSISARLRASLLLFVRKRHDHVPSQLIFSRWYQSEPMSQIAAIALPQLGWAVIAYRIIHPQSLLIVCHCW